MAAAFDIALKDNDLLIQNGDFSIDASDQQHIRDISASFKGWYKEFPQVGVGAILFLNGNDIASLKSELRKQLSADGYQYTDSKIERKDDAYKISIDAQRN